MTPTCRRLSAIRPTPPWSWSRRSSRKRSNAWIFVPAPARVRAHITARTGAARSIHVRAIGDHLSRLNEHVEADGHITGQRDLDVVRPRFEIQVLEDAIVVVHHSSVVAIHEHLRFG